MCLPLIVRRLKPLLMGMRFPLQSVTRNSDISADHFILEVDDADSKGDTANIISQCPTGVHLDPLEGHTFSPNLTLTGTHTYDLRVRTVFRVTSQWAQTHWTDLFHTQRREIDKFFPFILFFSSFLKCQVVKVPRHISFFVCFVMFLLYYVKGVTM